MEDNFIMLLANPPVLRESEIITLNIAKIALLFKGITLNISWSNSPLSDYFL